MPPQAQQSWTSVEDLIRQEADKAGVPVPFALGVAEQESSFNPGALGPRLKDGRQAVGVFQLLPETAKNYGVDPADPVQNVQGGVRYLRELFDRHQGNPDAILKEYGGVRTNTTYVPGVLARISRFQVQTPPPGGLGAPSSPAPAVGGSTTPSSSVAQPPPRPGFLQGLAESVLPFKSWEEAQAAGRAVAAEANPFLLAGRIGKGILAGQLEQFTEAGRAAKTFIAAPPATAARAGALAETVGRTAAGALPLLGPAAARAGEAIGRGETAYGAGQATGLVGTMAAGPALRTVGKTKATAGVIPLTRGERTGSATSKFLESLAEKTLPGRTRFSQFRARQQQALLDATDQAIARIAPTRKAYTSGAQILDDIEEAKQAFKAPIKERYAQITALTTPKEQRVPVIGERPSLIVGPSSQYGPASSQVGPPLTVPTRTLQKVEVGGVQPETRGLKEFAIPLLRRVRKEAELLPPDQLRPVIDSLERIIKSPKRLAYQSFQDARSDLLAIARRHGDPIPGKAGGLAKKLASLTDDAMEQAVEGSGLVAQTPEGAVPLQQFVRDTSRLWVEAEDTFNQSILAKMVEQAPERVHLLLEQGTLDDITTIKKFLPPPRQQELKAQLLRHWLLKDIQGEPLAPGIKGLVSGPPTVAVKGSHFKRQAEAFGRDRLEALFEAGETRELFSLVETAEQLAKRQNETVAGLIAGGVNVTLVTAGPSALLGFTGVPTVAGVTGGAAAINLAARLMTRPEGITGLRTVLRAIGTGRTPEALAASAQLRQIIEGMNRGVGEPPPGARQLQPSH